MKRTAIIVDRDGTLASVAHVAPQDQSSIAWAMFNAGMIFDAPVPAVRDMIEQARADGHVIIMMSGRAAGDHAGDTRRFRLMKDWLAKHDIVVDHLFMREGGDTRKDAEVKDELFREFVEPFFDVVLAIDDRDQVIEVWERHGIPVERVFDPGILPPIARQA